MSQVAERLGNWASHPKVASLIPGRAKSRCVLGQGTLPYLSRENVPVLTVSRSGYERLLNVKCKYYSCLLFYRYTLALLRFMLFNCNLF